MAIQYEQYIPVTFGCGAVKELGVQIKGLNCKKVLCVCDKGVRAVKIDETVTKILEESGVEYLIFDKVTPDPPDTMIDEGIAIARSEKIDGVIGIGGGSSMDTAKAIAALMKHPGSIKDYFTRPPTSLDVGVPVVLVPTTAGTGSEVTLVASLGNVQQNIKSAVLIRGTLAILDPELTKTLPPFQTASTGLDAFSHATESITNRVSNPKSEILALDAVRRITKYLPIACKDGNNMEARTNMSIASNFAGLAFANADNHFGHSIASAFYTAFHTTHGISCIWANPEVMRLVAQKVPDKVQLIGEAMGVDFTGNETPAEIGDKVAEAIHALMRACDIKSLKEMGFSREQVLGIADQAQKGGLVRNCPVDITPEIAHEVMEKIYDNYQ